MSKGSSVTADETWEKKSCGEKDTPCAADSCSPCFLLPRIHSQPHAPVFNPLPPIAFDTSGPVIQAHTEALKPFTVAGERGVLVGQQDGTFEAWPLPMKLLSHLTIEADVEGYTVPIDVNQQSSAIEVRPDRTVITYAHIGFTVRQIMFSPADAPAGTGPVVLFEFDCLHPTDFTLRFTPELRWMWPERNEGVPGVEWVAPAPNAYERAGGFYVLHADYPDFAAAVTIPGARPGILAPYQERPQVHPVELKLHIDPARDHGKLYPLLMAYAATASTANSASLAATLEKLNAAIPDLYKTHAENWKKTLANSVSIDTPDKALNEAFQWAVISIEQLKTKTIPGQSSVHGCPTTYGLAPGLGRSETPGIVETALVAGYYASGDSARPGFGWFFGRDALYTLYAVNGYGNFALSKSELEFLIRRQRDDGKIMHEWSQTAAAIDWRAFPYMYAAADATPLFLLATLDYVHNSGDLEFLTAHRDAIEKAWNFETSHADTQRHLRQPPGHRLGRKLARRHAPPGNLSRAARPAGLRRHGADRIPAPRPAEIRSRAGPRRNRGQNHRVPVLRPAEGLLRLQPQCRRLPRPHHHRLSLSRLVEQPLRHRRTPHTSPIPKAACVNSPRTPSTPTGASATCPTKRRSTTA